MSPAEQLFSMQDSTLSTKAELEQRHCSSLALQLPTVALPMQLSAQAVGGRGVVSEGAEGGDGPGRTGEALALPGMGGRAGEGCGEREEGECEAHFWEARVGRVRGLW